MLDADPVAPSSPTEVPSDRRLVRLMVAVAIGVVLSRVAWIIVPRHLSGRTDVVGYPTFANFDINRYFDAYYLAVIVFPAIAVAAYYALWRWGPLHGPRGHKERDAERGPKTGSEEALDPAPRPSAPATLRGATRSALVAATVGLEVYFAVGGLGAASVVAALVTACLYLGAVGVVATLCPAAGTARPRAGIAPRSTFLSRASLVNAYGAISTLPLLFWVSSQTEVTVAANGSHHHYPWLPGWLLVVLIVGAIWIILRAHRSSQASGSSDAAENASLVWLVGPVLIFLGTAVLPGAVGVSAFESGQPVASAYLIFVRHLLPWKDVQFIHGLLGDPIIGAVGLALFGKSNWGYIAGRDMVLNPLCWVAVYLFAAYTYQKDRLFLLGVGLAIVMVTFLTPPVRFIFYPIQLILLTKVLRTRSITWVAAFSLVTILQFLATPETAYAVVALGGTLIAFEGYQHFRGAATGFPLYRTSWALVTGVIWSAALGVLFAVTGMLPGFIQYFLIVAPDHSLTGGLPISWLSSHQTVVWAALPIVLILSTVWLFAARLGARRDLGIEEWITLAAAGFVLFYYTKELGRDDPGHVLEVFWVLVPLIILWLHRILEWIDLKACGPYWSHAGKHLPSGLPVTVTIVVSLIVLLVGQTTLDPHLGFQSPAQLVTELGSHYHPVAAVEPQSRRLGYTSPGSLSKNLVTDLRKVLNDYAGRNGPVFDFTNAPLLYYFLLDRLPGTRFFQVSMAQPTLAQDELIQDLKKSKPKIVIFSSTSIGLPWWDGLPNMVRHYDVSQYLLDTYRPLLAIDGELVMLRDTVAHVPPPPSGLSETPETDMAALYSDSPVCSWGDIPNFLSPGPRSGQQGSVTVTLQRLTTQKTLVISGWAVNATGRAPAERVVAVVGGRVVATAVPSINSPDVEAPLYTPSVLGSGFTLAVKWSLLHGKLSAVSVFAVTAGGILEPLRASTASNSPTFATPWRQVSGPSPGTVYQIARTTRTAGVVETAEVSAPTVFKLIVTKASDLAAFHWLTLTYAASLANATYVLSDVEMPIPDQEITFASLPQSGDHLSVRVGSCLQWHGFSASTIYLGSSDNSMPSQVTLSR